MKAFHYDTEESLATHTSAFVTAYDFGEHLKAPRRRAPVQAICDAWARDPASFKVDPRPLIPASYT